MDRRGRITIVEVVTTLFALGFVGALWPVVSTSLDGAVSEMTAGEVYLIRLLLPMMLLVMLSILYATATQGGNQIR